MLKYLKRRIPVPEIYFELYPKWDGLIVRLEQSFSPLLLPTFWA